MPVYFSTGDEVAVNTQAAGSQRMQSAMRLSDGSFVVVWETTDTAQDGSGSAIKMQRFSATGTLLGTETLVNTQAAGNQINPQVAVLGNGNFVVTWQTLDIVQDGSGSAIKAQMFDAGGVKIGVEFQVNSQTAFNQQLPMITALSGGGFAIAWQTTDTVQDGSGSAIRALLFDASGAFVGTEFLVNSTTAGNQADNDIVGLASGGFLVTWTGTYQTSTEVFGQVFNADGTANGAEFLITNAAGNQSRSRATALADGGFVVTWFDSALGVQAQLFDANRNPVGGQLLPSTGAVLNGAFPDVVTLINGDFVISWQVPGSGVYVRAFTPTGELLGNQLTVPWTSGDGSAYSTSPIVALSNGGFAVIAAKGVNATPSPDLDMVFFVQNRAPELGAATRNVFVQETSPQSGTSTIYVSATDDGGPTAPTYSIIGGSDAARFVLHPQSGTLTFASPPNFEAPTDVNGDNVYEVIVRATDSDLSDQQTIFVTVTNVNEAPIILSNDAGVSAAISVAENSVVATTVAASDQEGTAIVYSLAGGADASRFIINATTGELRFVSAPNFEAPNDVGANNIYNVTVAATSGGLTDTQALAITVINANESVVITSNGGGDSATLSVAENVTAVTSVTSADPEGMPRTYAIAGGADAALFTIDAATGVLGFNGAPNFEAPADADANNVYDVSVSASDGVNTDTQSLTITVADANEAPIITSDGGGGAVSVTINENTVIVTMVASTDPENTARFYSISGGADADLFAINAANGALSLVAPANFEAAADAGADNVYDVIVSASDGVNIDTQALAITIANVNEGLSIISSNNFSVAENQTDAASVTAVDIDGTAPFYAIVGGADAALFAIDAATGALSFIAQPDFESPGDVGGDNVYDVTVSATDGSFVDPKALTVTVGNANEGVVITSTAAFGVSENATTIGTITASDLDGDAVSYAISGGADAALFSIDTATGALNFVTAPDFEVPGDTDGDNIYQVTVAASDGSLSTTQAVAVTVGNRNEAPVVTSGGAVAANENDTVAATITASDVDGPAISFAIAGGADAALFTIDAASGVLSFVGAPDFEAPADAGGDNIYDVIVSASDGSLLATQSLGIAVTNINEGVSITSGAGFVSEENQVFAATVTAVDADGTSPVYSIVGGADASLFAIDATTGALSFITAPNFEASADDGGDNVYDVVVAATDGSFTDTKALTVSVVNANEGLSFTSAPTATIQENGTSVATIAATDIDGDAAIYAIQGGADAALFSVNATTGALSFIAAPNFEVPTDADANNVYDVILSATDGSFVDTQTIAVTVTNVNEAAAITSDGADEAAVVNANENGVAVTSVAAIDPDGAAISYSLAGGADAAKFTIDPTSGALQFIVTPNFEAPTDVGGNNVYDVIVAATDGTSIDTQALAVNITNVNEAVAITSNGGGDNASISINENVVSVATVAGIDTDGGAVSYAIAGGADAAKFAINAATGALQFIAAPNFEVPTDAGGNNVYDVVVAASDGVFADTQTIAVTINNVVDGATVTGTSGNDIISNTATLVQFRSTNAEDAINTLGGTDTISGGGGDDVINSGDGNDTIQYSGLAEGFDRVDGGAGTDTIVALANNTVIGLASITGIEAISAGSFTGVSISGSTAADTLNFASMTLTGVTKIDGGAGNDTITGTAAAATLAGGAGDDTLTGRNGSDTFLFSGIGDGFDAITGGSGTDTIRANANNTIIGLRSLATVEAISAGGFTGVSISGSSAADTLNFSSVTLTGITNIDGGAGNDIITGSSAADVLVGGLGNDTLTGGNGIDTVDYSYSSSNWTINLAATSAQAVSGTETDTIATAENVIGGSGNDTITGTTGNNNLKGGAGADRIRGGLGNDVLDGSLGIDVAVYSGLQASYSLTTLNGVVTIVDNQASVDGNDGTDTLVGFETVEFKGGAQVALALPIVLDLNGDGITLISQTSSTARFDWNGDGMRDKTGWVGSDDGILFFDRDGNGTVSGADELSFVNDKPGAKSDLDGLSAFDSNGDGQFSGLDGKWSSFNIWQDRNSDGAVDASELSSLASAGVSSINLTGQAVNKTWSWNENLTLNNGQFTRVDGGEGRLADVALSYQTSAARKADIHSLSAKVEALRAGLGPSSGGLQSYLTLPDNVNLFDYFGDADAPLNDKPIRHHPTFPAAIDPTLIGLDTCVHLMRQDMASFGVRHGEGNFGSQREQQGRYDYFA